MRFKNFFLTESTSDIVGLSYPPIVAKIFHEKFGNLAFLFAKWFRDYKYHRDEKPDNWWLQTMANFRESPSLWDLTYLYGATNNYEDYQQALRKLELEPHEEVDLDEQREALERAIKDKLLDNTFFRYNQFVQDILSGKLKDLAPYKKLSFQQAEDKYDKKNIFKDKQPLKIYPNGYKWIDVGLRCQYAGKLMRNCGSAGLIGFDPDRTLLVLFDKSNKAHVMLTYSPNEKRLSTEVGVGSSEVKTKYHEYVLDLAKFLQSTFDVDKARSMTLRVKYLLSSIATDIEQIPYKGSFDEYYKFVMGNKTYYTNGYAVASEDDIKTIQSKVKNGEVILRNNNQNDIIKNAFNHLNMPILRDAGINYIPLKQLAHAT